ncbi:MAG: hydrogenase, partial [Salinibacter sp.]
MIDLDVVDPESADREVSGPTFWRHWSEEEADNDEEEDALTEFAPGESEPPGGASRRQFLQLMGAAMAMAGLAGCRRPEQKILPYTRKPETVIPGIADYYATAMPFRGVLRPVVARSNEGRPTKIEGNGDHPMGQKGTSPFEQASVLNLYDPDRSRSVWHDGNPAGWGDFVSFCRQLGTEAEQRRVAVLVEETSSPTVQAMRQRMEDRFPNLQWIDYSPEGTDARRLGMQQAFGRPLRPRYELGEAEVIVSLDANFLDGRSRDFLYNTKTFAEGRRLEDAEDTMSRLYTVESRYSTTGGTSDHRLPMRAGRIPAFAAALAAELGVGNAPEVSWSEKERLYVREIVRDLKEAGENGVVLVGESQPPEVHALAMAVNQRLGGIGTTVTLFDTGASSVQPQDEALADLTASMQAGDVDTLFMLGVNPVYDAPSALNFEEALSNVQDTVHLGRLRNETAQAARWHVPRTHYLEQWGDGRAYDGTLSVIQPLIRPLYDDAHSMIEVLNLAATGVNAKGHDLVREQWRPRIDGPFEEQWRETLHDGYLEGTQYDVASVGEAEVPTIEPPASDPGLEVVFRPDPKLLSGRFSNNPWMQELPDPITKITWDNVAVMSQATAEELGVEVNRREGSFFADRVELTLDGQTVELPVWTQPGYPDGSIGVSMGYGRTIASTRESESTPFWDTRDETNIYFGAPVAGGVDASGNGVDVVGVNVAPMRPTGGRVTTGAEITKVDSGYLIATTQEEGSMHGRPIVRWATLEEFKEDPYFVNDSQPPVPELGHGGEGEGGGHGGGGQGGDHGGDGAPQDVSGRGLEAGPGTDAHAA